MNEPQVHRVVMRQDDKADDLSRLSIPALVTEYFISHERIYYELCRDDAGDGVSPAEERNGEIQNLLAAKAPATLRDSAELIRFMRHKLLRCQANAAEIFPEAGSRGQHELLGRVYLQICSAVNRERQERQDMAIAKEAAAAAKAAPSSKPVAAKPIKARKPAGGTRRVDVMLTEFGDRKINVIKEVLAITALGLKEAKDLVEGAPKTVKEGCSKAEAEEIKAKLEGAGAAVKLVPATPVVAPHHRSA